MKTYFSLLAVSLLALSSCTAPDGAASRGYSDDVYYSSKDAAADRELAKAEAARKAEEAKRARAAEYTAAEQKTSTEPADDYYKKSTTETTTDEKGNTYVTNNYYDQPFDYDDYYDYEYTARLRRFHNNVGYYGYYDNYYTNAYWYSGNPYNYGTSIYLGYNWWGPSYYSYSYYPQMCYYNSWGWGYDPWYNPWGGWGYGYGYGYGYPYYGSPYMNGYYNGYNQGYWDGYYSSNYFNSYDNNSYYYGPRGTTGANSRTTAQPLASRYVNKIEQESKLQPGMISSREDLHEMAPQYVNSTLKPGLHSGNGKPSIGTTLPANTTKPGQSAKPEVIDNGRTKPGADDYYKPEDRPSIINNSDNGKGVERPVNEKPVMERPNPANEKPVFERPRPVREQPKQINEPEKPRFERQTPQRETPRQEAPRQQRFEQPKQNSPAPSGGGSPRGGSPSPSGGGPRKR